MNRWRAASGSADQRRCRGTIAVEFALVLVILLLGLWLAFEIIDQVGRQQRAQRLAADLRQFAELIEPQRPYFPAARAAAEAPPFPPVLAHALDDTNWKQGSPFGGSYEYLPATGPAGAIGVTAFAPHFPLRASRADWERVDRLLDDGNLAAGRFRAGYNGWPVYWLEAAR